jgi:hypothetical protein
VGTWGCAPFDNDDAVDLLDDLAEADDVDLVDTLRDALAQVADGDGYLDAPEVSEAVAAACLVAARLPGGPRPEDPAATDLLDDRPFEVDDDLRIAGSRALERAFVRDDNEWYELWEDADALDEVSAALAPYRVALGGD